MGDAVPGFYSAALAEMPVPDFADVVVAAVPAGREPVTLDPADWAAAVYDIRASPNWVATMFLVRSWVVGLIGVPAGDEAAFAVDDVIDGEAVIRYDEHHLEFRSGVAYDPQTRLLRVTTAAHIIGRRGRLYFIPIRWFHGPVMQAMARSAVRRLTSRAA